MEFPPILRTACALTATALPGPVLAATAPSAGALYEAVQTIKAIQSTPSACGSDQVGDSGAAGELFYPGPGVSGAMINSGGASAVAVGIGIIALPKMPSASGVTVSGSLTQTVVGQGPGTGTSKTGTVSLTFTYVDANAFYGVITTSFPANGGTCKETLGVTFLRTGK